MADTRAVELNEAFAGCELRRLLDWVVVDDRQRRVGLFDDRCLLGLGDGELGGHCRVEYVMGMLHRYWEPYIPCQTGRT